MLLTCGYPNGRISIITYLRVINSKRRKGGDAYEEADEGTTGTRRTYRLRSQ